MGNNGTTARQMYIYEIYDHVLLICPNTLRFIQLSRTRARNIFYRYVILLHYLIHLGLLFKDTRILSTIFYTYFCDCFGVIDVAVLA